MSTDLNIKLLPWQQEVWDSKARFKVVVEGRRTGKCGDTTIIGEQEPDIEEGQIVNLNPLESD